MQVAAPWTSGSASQGPVAPSRGTVPPPARAYRQQFAPFTASGQMQALSVNLPKTDAKRAKNTGQKTTLKVCDTGVLLKVVQTYQFEAQNPS